MLEYIAESVKHPLYWIAAAPYYMYTYILESLTFSMALYFI